MPDPLGLTPGQIGRAFRAAFPNYRSDIQTDEELYMHLAEKDPEGIKQLAGMTKGSPTEGAYLPKPGDWQKAYSARQGKAATPLPTTRATGNILTTAASTAARVIPPVATGVATSLGALPTFGASIPAAMAATGGAAAAGESLAQKGEEYLGLRDEINPTLIGTAGAFGAIPGLPVPPAVGPLVRTGIRAAEGAGLSMAQQETEARLTGAPPPNLRERATAGAFGAAFGGGFGAYEARSIRKTYEAAAEQMRQRTMTREGLAQTIARIAEDAELEGHTAEAARRYAKDAAKALYQGRPMPEMPRPEYPTEFSPEMARKPEGAALEKPPTAPTEALPAGVQQGLRDLGYSEDAIGSMSYPDATRILEGKQRERRTVEPPRATTPEEHMRQVLNDPEAQRAGRALEQRVRDQGLVGTDRQKRRASDFAQPAAEARPVVEASPTAEQLNQQVDVDYTRDGWAEDPRYAGSDKVRYYRKTGPVSGAAYPPAIEAIAGHVGTSLERPPGAPRLVDPTRGSYTRTPPRPQFPEGQGPHLPPPPGIAEGPLPEANPAVTAGEQRFSTALDAALGRPSPTKPRLVAPDAGGYTRTPPKPQFDQPQGPALPPPPSLVEGPLPEPNPAVTPAEQGFSGALDAALGRPAAESPRLVNPEGGATARPAAVPPDAAARAAARKLSAAGTKNVLQSVPKFGEFDATAVPTPRSGDVPPTPKEEAAFEKGAAKAAKQQVKQLAPPMRQALEPPPKPRGSGRETPAKQPDTSAANPADQGAAAVKAYAETGSMEKAAEAAARTLPPPPTATQTKDVLLVGDNGDPIGTARVPASYDQPVISEAEYNSLYRHPLENPENRQLYAGLDPSAAADAPLGFEVPPGDTAALKSWLAANRQYSSEGFYKRAQAALDAKNPARAWQVVQAETLRRMPAGAANKARVFAGMRGERGSVRQQEAGVRRTDTFPQPANVKPKQRGRLILRPSGLKDVGDMPPPTTIDALPESVQARILKAVKRAQLGRIKGNQDTDYRLFRQVAHQVLEGDAKMRSISRALGLTPEELAKGWTSQVSEAARVLQRLSQLSREIPNVVEEVAAKSGIKPPKGVKQAMAALETANTTDEGLQQLYGGLFGLDPSAALQWAKDSAAAMNEVHAAHLLEQQTNRGPLAAFNDLRRAGLTGTIASFWRNAAVGGLRWNAGIMSDAIGAILSVDPTVRRELAGRAKDRITAAPHLWNTIAKPWGSSIYEMWPDLAKVALAGRDPRKTLKAISSFDDAEAHFLGMKQKDLPQSSGQQQYVTLIQSANRAQEYPLRALASDLRLRQLVRRRGFDPNVVLNDPQDLSRVFGSPEAAERAVQDAVGYGLDFTFASDTIPGTINAALIETINKHPFLSAFQSFPRYAWSAAPRFVWDHSPGVLVDMAVQVASRGKIRLGQRFMRGQQTALASEMLSRRETRLNEISLERGKALQDRMALSKTRAILRRKIDSLERHEEKGTITTQQRQSLGELQRQMSETNGALNGQLGYLGRLQAEQQTLSAQTKKLAKGYQESAGAAAPESIAEVLGKASVGVMLWSAAHALRSGKDQQDLPWYKIRTGDDTVVDARAFGPLTFYLFLGDLTASVGKDTDIPEFRKLQQEKIAAGTDKKIATLEALKESYHGKYSEGQALKEAGQLVFGLSPAAGVTAAAYDMLGPEGLSTETLGESALSLVGEWLAGPLQPLSDISNLLSPVFPGEAVIRDPSMLAPETPLAELSAPLAKIPGVKQLFPPQYSQTSGEVVRSESPITRTLGGITLAKPPNAVESVLQEAGVPGNKYYLPRLDDVGMTQELSKVHAESLHQMYDEFIRGNPEWDALKSPEERRTYLEMPGGPLAFARTLTWATMQDYGEEKIATLRESPARAAAARRQLRLLERWSEGQMPPDETDSSTAPAPALPPPPGGSPRSLGLPPPPRF